MLTSIALKLGILSTCCLGTYRGVNLFEKRKARAIIIRAERGVKVWSSGFDIRELPIPGRDPLSYNDPLEQALRSIQLFPAPVIAMIEGSVWGGACDLSFICDLTIGCPSCSFAITPAKIGVPCNSPLAISVIKEQLRLLGNSHPLSPETFERIQGLRRKAYDSFDYLEGKNAFYEKRPPKFKGE